MARIKVPSGTKQNLETVFDDLQSIAADNLKRRILKVFDRFGPIVDVKAGILTGGTSLQVTTGSNLSVNIAAGEALLENGNLIRIDSGDSETLSGVSASTAYVIILTYAEEGTVPVTAQNAFLYDVSGGTPYSTKKTRYIDAYTITYPEVETFADITTELSDNKIALGVIKIASNGTSFQSSFTFDGVAAISGVVELRHLYSLKINSSLLNEDDIVFSDRSSIIDAGYSFTAPTLHTNSTTGTSGFAGKIEAASISTPILQGTAITGSSATISGAGSFGSLTVGGVAVQTDEGVPTIPANLRIWDIWPTNNPSEPKGFIWFRWNWTHLVKSGAPAPGDTGYTNVSISATTSQGEDFSPINAEVAGKKLKMANDAEYTIHSLLSDNGTTIVLKVAGTVPDSFPVKIIDANADGYYIAMDVEGEVGYKMIFNLDSDFITDPQFKTKLDLSKEIDPELYNCKIKTYNDTRRSSYATLLAGTYDPDQGGSDQDPVDYEVPFAMRLPDIKHDGTLSIATTANGVLLTIGGWNLGGQQTLHEYEYAYATAEEGYTETLSSLTDGGLTHIISPSRTLAITANAATRFVCGVRGLQNKQVVTEEKYTVPTAGGFAKEAVQDQVLIQKVGAEVKVRRGIIGGPASTSGSSTEWTAVIHDPVNDDVNVAVGDGYLDGEYININGDATKNFKIARQSLSITDV